MSISVEPVRFSQPPSSPGFSSPPQSPNHHIHTTSPPPLPPPANDIDMSSSIATLASAGQRHDRDADMQEGVGEGLTNGHVEEPAVPSSNHPLAANTNTVAVEVAAMDDDAMDTTPDLDAQLVQADGEHNPLETALASSMPPTDGAAADEPASNDQLLPVAPPADVTEILHTFPIDPPPPADPNSQPPPPPPPVDPIRSDSESSDDDDGLQPWHPIQEDTSSPDEVELKEMEATTEHSALDHEYWESKAFLPLEEPEYTAGESGRINWSIEAYNGTREKPNRDIVMKSEVVTVGGHQWQIKFYPRGNDSDYLSLYLECLSVVDPSKKKKKKEDDDKSDTSSVSDEAPKEEGQPEVKGESEMESGEAAPVETPAYPEKPTEPQHAPLPLLDGKSVPKRKSVAAQVSVVLYNPTEPRVHYSKTALHRFCSGSPDWGWTRFHGPYYDISHRMRGHRAALLREDKLAFTAYIRVVDDETNCLWEHHSRENPWDSFAMTGLQSLALGEDASAPGGNMISAVSSWLLFKPFRKILYDVDTPDPEVDFFMRPKPLVTALQKVLYMLRTQVEPGAGAVALDDVLEALDWYGITDRLDKLDVIGTWEVLRTKLEDELRDTTHADALLSLFGPKRDYSSGIPTYRVPVVDMDTMQNAINSSPNFAVTGQPLPQMLTIELDRQDFDVKTRSYVKLLNKVTLDDHITIGETSYTLYGFVVHKQTLQSYVYQPIFRPEGPGSRWYSYSDSKDENQVKCLTKNQALGEHEGKEGKGQIVGNDPIAYIAMYIRNDVAQAAFTCDAETELWTVPKWVRAEVDIRAELQEGMASGILPIPPMPIPVAEKSLDFRVVDSRIFKDHEGPGIFDAYETECTFKVQISNKSSCDTISDTLLPLFPEVQDRRQILFWFLVPAQGSLGRPQFLTTGKTIYSRGAYDRHTEGRTWTLGDCPVICPCIWVHILDFADLPEPPKPEAKESEPAEAASALPVADEMQAEMSHVDDDRTITPPPHDVAPRTEDTPMSEPDEPIDASTAEASEAPAPPADIPAPANDVEAGDTAMVEVESSDVPDPPPVDVLVPEPTAPGPGDTEMGGTQEELLLIPPPPFNVFAVPTELLQPPPLVRPRSPDPPPEEIYFFLKIWNAEKQALDSHGSHVCLKSARVDETVVKLLGLPMEDKKKVELCEEDEMTSTRPIKHRRSFAQLDLQNTCIIIASLPLTPDQRSALAERAAFADPQSYLAHRAQARNFPQKMNGHFTYNYFSDQYYKGEITNGHRHGHGLRIYHSGATYTGSFRLGQCHGHGLYTFQNGDTYDGEWADNQQHGSGTFVEAATGNTYVGGWKNDKKFGEGVTHWKNAQEAERLCRICWDEPAEAAFYDCGHVVACLPCAREVQTCPVCRKRVLSAMKLYYVA